MKKKISIVALIAVLASLFALPVQASGSYIVASGVIGGLGGQIGLGLLIGAVLAIIICLVLRAGMKSVRSKGEANDYVVGQLQLGFQNDRYSHTTTRRVKVNNDKR